MSRWAVSLSVLLVFMRVACGQDRPEQGDVNGDGRLNVGDAVYLLRYIFGGGSEPVDVPCAACDSCCPKVSGLLKTGFDLNLDFFGWPTLEPPGGYCSEDGCNQVGVSRHYELVTFGSRDPEEWITVDYATGLMWETQCPEDRFDGVHQAAAYCESLRLGPFDDWRLPTINELLTLVTLPHERYPGQLCDRTVYRTYAVMDRDFFRWLGWPWYPGLHSYWSSTIAVSWLVSGCQVYFGTAYFFYSVATDMPGYGRAVRHVLPGDLERLGLPEKPSGFYREARRNGDVDGNGTRDVADVVYLLAYLFAGGPALASNDCPACDSCCPDFPARPLQTGAGGSTEPGVPRNFEVFSFGSDDPGEWVTVDHATGLMWQYAYEGEILTYIEAAAVGRTFGLRHLGGFADWRIPNIFEILSLVNYGRNSGGGYPGVFAYPPWGYGLLSSTLYVQWPGPSDCACGFRISEAYTVDFTSLMLLMQRMLTGRSSVYLRFVRTIQPGDLDR